MDRMWKEASLNKTEQSATFPASLETDVLELTVPYSLGGVEMETLVQMGRIQRPSVHRLQAIRSACLRKCLSADSFS